MDLLLSSGRPFKSVAEDLGVCANSLREWCDRAVSVAADGGHGEEELRRLRL